MVNKATGQDAITSLASRLFLAMDWLALAPDGATPKERRSYNIGVIGFPSALIFHFLFIFLFAYWGIPQLALFNILSVLVWSACILLLRKQNLNLSFLLAAIELPVHAALVIYFVGWGMGIQYYLINLILVIVVSFWSLWSRLASTLILTAFFLILYYYALGNSPQVSIDPTQLNIVNILVTSAAFLLIAAMMFYPVARTDQLEAQLEAEHKKSEALLNNILPEAISARLKSSKDTIADHCEGASILFADVVDFTPMSATMTPTELVELLNGVFSDFDMLTEKYGLEKIKTIGDCYMVASGVPQPRADHAQVLTRMALEMQERVNNQKYNGHKLAFRIGINSGPVVAGVIGRQKFAYDLWGDAVNTASRMESNGTDGRIQITKATYDLIKDDFICDPQGTIQVKGKGEMDVWHVLDEQI